MINFALSGNWLVDSKFQILHSATIIMLSSSNLLKLREKFDQIVYRGVMMLVVCVLLR